MSAPNPKLLPLGPDPTPEAMEVMSFILPGFITGGYVTAWLAGMVLGECVRVLYSFPHDGLGLRSLVGLCFLLSTIHFWWWEEIAEHYSALAFEDMMQLDRITPQLGLHVLFSRALIVMAQLFFCHRLWIFSTKNRVVTLTSILLVFGHVAMSILTALTFVEAKHYARLNIMHILYLLYSSAIACDVVITGSLMYFLSKQKSQFLKTQSMIKQIMVLSFQTSFVTTALAVVSIVVLGYVGLGVLYALSLLSSQLYVLSVVITLNSRADFARAWASETNKSVSFSIQNHVQDHKRSPYEGVGVQVDQVVITDVDADGPTLALPKFAKVRTITSSHNAAMGGEIPVYAYFARDPDSIARPTSGHRVRLS